MKKIEEVVVTSYKCGTCNNIFTGKDEASKHYKLIHKKAAEKYIKDMLKVPEWTAYDYFGGEGERFYGSSSSFTWMRVGANLYELYVSLNYCGDEHGPYICIHIERLLDLSNLDSVIEKYFRWGDTRKDRNRPSRKCFADSTLIRLYKHFLRKAIEKDLIKECDKTTTKTLASFKTNLNELVLPST